MGKEHSNKKMKATAVCGAVVLFVALACSGLHAFPQATHAQGDANGALKAVHGSRPSAPAVDVQLDAFQVFPSKRQVKQAVNETASTQAANETITVSKPTKAQSIVHAINNHHQQLVKTLATKKSRKELLAKTKLDLPAHLQVHKGEEVKVTTPETSASSPAASVQTAATEPAAVKVAAPAPAPASMVAPDVTTTAPAMQQPTSAETAAVAQQQITAPVPAVNSPTFHISEEQIQHMTEDELRKALLDQVHSTPQAQPQQPQEQEQQQYRHRIINRAHHNPSTHTHQFTLNVPKANMAQVQEDFPANGAPAKTPEPTPDPRCVPVEICTGGSKVAYSDGVPDLVAAANAPAEKGMCYKWCPIGCACC